MHSHSTNYYDTFIGVAADSPAVAGTVPPLRNGQPTIASMQFEILHNHPYSYTSDEVLFRVYADRKELTQTARIAAKREFFGKGQACFRASPLAKRYGWGIHFDSQGKMAVFGCETPEYARLIKDPLLKCLKAMRNSRAGA